VTSRDCETGKGIAHMSLNACARLNNEMKARQLKNDNWAMNKEALEAGVPGMDDVVANFIEQQFASRYGPKAPVLVADTSLNALVAEKTGVSHNSNL
jgi:hypothetical protein